MAGKEALKKLEEELQCAICLSTYTEPKLLDCSHVFCAGCLPKKLDNSLTCPTCRKITPLPESEGVQGLQPAFRINNLLDIQKSLMANLQPSDPQQHSSTKKEEKREDDDANLPPCTSHPAVPHCAEHAKRELKLYCEKCEKPVCIECAIDGSQHYTHKPTLLETTCDRYKAEVRAALEPVKETITTISDTLSLADRKHEEISQQQEAIEAEIHATARVLHQALDTRTTDLLSQLQQLTQAKLKSLSSHRNEIETTLVKYQCCDATIEEKLNGGTDLDIVTARKDLLGKINSLALCFHPDLLRLKESANLKLALRDTVSACLSFGHIEVETTSECSADLKLASRDTASALSFGHSEVETTSECSADLKLASRDTASACLSFGHSGVETTSKCFIVVKNLASLKIQKKSSILLQITDFANHPYEGDIDSLECKFISELAGTKLAKISCKKREKNLYELSFTPTVKGYHQLLVKINGEDVPGTPLSVPVKKPIETIDCPIATIKDVSRPWGIVLNKRRELVVTEQGKHCVSVFSPRGDRLWSFGKQGSIEGELNKPCGIALDQSGNIFVADSGNYRIQKFTPEGKFLKAVGTKGRGDLQFRRLRGLAHNTFNSLVYVINGNYIKIFDEDLSFCSSFSSFTIVPLGIACDNSGQLFLSDWVESKVAILTSNGEVLSVFSVSGVSFPFVSIAIGSDGLLYFSQYDLKCQNYINVVTSEGRLIKKLQGSRKLMFTTTGLPNGLAVDDSGVIYLCEYNTNQITLF